MLKIFSLVCTMAAIVVSIKDYNYQEYRNLFTCEGRPHTFWVFKSEKTAPICHTPLQIGLQRGDKELILRLHNNIRQKVARGEETRGKPGPQPPARVMRDLTWDDELADMAQRWANQCNFDFDQCRDVERFKVAQLAIKIEEKTDLILPSANIESLVNIWYDYCKEFDGNVAEKYNKSAYEDSQARFYTQLVWANTSKIGCGLIKYPIPNFNRLYLVCNYGPSGMQDGEAVYLTF